MTKTIIKVKVVILLKLKDKNIFYSIESLHSTFNHLIWTNKKNCKF